MQGWLWGLRVSQEASQKGGCPLSCGGAASWDCVSFRATRCDRWKWAVRTWQGCVHRRIMLSRAGRAGPWGSVLDLGCCLSSQRSALALPCVTGRKRDQRVTCSPGGSSICPIWPEARRPERVPCALVHEGTGLGSLLPAYRARTRAARGARAVLACPSCPESSALSCPQVTVTG